MVTPTEYHCRERAHAYFTHPPQHILCWDLDGVLVEGNTGNLHPQSPIILRTLSPRWTHCITTASDGTHAQDALKTLDALTATIFLNIGIPGGKNYTLAQQQFPGHDLVAIGNEATDAPQHIPEAIFIYGTNLPLIQRALFWMDLLGLGDLHKGYEELQTAWKNKKTPALFGELRGTRTIYIE